MIKENKIKFKKIMLIMFTFMLFSVVGVNATLEDGLTAYYNPEVENNYNDLSGSGYDGTEYITSTDLTLFDGNDDYVYIPKSITNVNDYSLSFKFNAQNVSSGRLVIGRGIGEAVTLFDIYFSSGKILDSRYDGNSVNTISSTSTLSIGTEYIVTFVYNGNTKKIFIDGTLDKTLTDSSSYSSSPGSNYFLGRYTNDPSTSNFGGYLYNTLIYNRALSDTEVLELYNNGGVPTSETTSATQQTYSQSQLANIAINNTDWHTITSGSFEILEDNTNNYGETIVYATSYTDDMIISCRTNLDGVDGLVETPLILQNGETNSNILLRGSEVLNSGIHTVEIECKNDILGNTLIGASVAIGHVMKTSSGDDINYISSDFTQTVNSGTTFSDIGSNFLITPEYTTDNNYIIVDWSTQINNTQIYDQTLSVYPSISNALLNQNCEQVNQFVKAGEYKTVGGICKVKLNSNVINSINLWGTGIGVDYTGTVNIKEIDYTTSEEIKTNILTGIDVVSSSFTEYATTTITTTSSNSELVVKGQISAISSTDNILYGEIQVLDETETVIYESKEIAMNTNIYDNSLTFQTIVPVATGTNTLKLLLRTDTGLTISINGGEITGYITNKLDIIDNSIEIQAFEFWDNTQLSDFSVVIGETTYTTTGTTINAVGEYPYQNIIINKDDYISRLFEQHDTTTNLNASIGQHQINIKATEIYTNKTINEFSIETEIGTFETTTGVITLYPFTNIYNWNITLDNYFNKLDEEFQVGGTLTETTITDFYDAALTFEDESSLEIYPTCSWLGNTLTESTGYNIATQQSIGNNITCSISGFSTITNDFSLFTVPFSNLFTMNETEININIYDRTTGDLITTSSQVTVIGPDDSTQITTLTGIAQIKNISFDSGDYQILVTNSDYETEIIYFTFDNQETIQQDIYMIPTTEENLGIVYIKVVDEQTIPLEDILVKVEEWRSSTNSFVSVGQSRTSLDGKAQLNVELNSKVYRFTAMENDLSVTSINQVVYTTGTILTLRLPTDTTSVETYLNHITASFSAENVTGSTLVNSEFTFSDSNNVVYKSCIELYEINGFTKSKIDEECLLTSSGTINLLFDINKTYSQQLLFTITVDGQRMVLNNEYTFAGNTDISVLLENYNLHLWLPLLFTIIGIASGLYMRNIYISLISLLILIWVVNGLVPAVLSTKITAVLSIFIIIGIWGGSKR